MSVGRAITLRRDTTDAEKRLWRHLRNRPLRGQKFRRQRPVGPYVVDFMCLESRLVVEVDGGQHSPDTDRERTRYLERQGFRVLRFWNNEVLGEIEGVLARIVEALEEILG
jgi:adenine-specific DNA-methyltransferase